ncbi:hypothetical protein CFI11_13600 [Thalassococcus sp. S3]|nr:hypothetical protein CFI11_13600 [Thalassococcus sp. S3]
MPRRGRRRAKAIGLWSLASVSLLCLVLGAGILLLIGRTMAAPDWLTTRIEERIERNLDGLQIEFGDVELVVNEGWRPRARLRDVSLSQADGRPILQLADAEASLAMRPLLRGQVQPRTIRLRGAFAVLRRDAAGAVTLAFDDASTPVEEAAGMSQLLKQVDRFFERDIMSALSLIELDALTLQYEDVQAGRAWTIDGGFVGIEREQDELRLTSNFAVLSGRDHAAALEVNYATEIGAPTAEFGISLSDFAAQDFADQSLFPVLAFLEALRAPVSGSLRGRIEEGGALGPLSATLQIGRGVLQPTDQARPIPFDGARTYFTYDPAEEVLTFDEVSVQSAWVNGVAEGEAYISGLSEGRLEDLVGQVELTAFSVNPRGLYDQPVRLNGAAADFRLQLDPFALSIGRMEIRDQGQIARLSGRLAADEAGWTVAVDGDMNGVTPDRLVRLWPEAAIPKTRSWIAENLSGGQLSDINFALRTAPGSKPDVYLDFDYEDAQIRFMKTMPPIVGANGQASLVRNRFVTTATSGRIEAETGRALDVAGTSFIIPDVSIKQAAPAVVRLAGQGSVTSVLSLLNREPLKILEQPGLPEDLAEGRVEATGTLALPLLERVEIEDVEFHVSGTAFDVSTDELVPGRTLRAEQLAIRASDQSVAIFGAGTMDGVPAEARWEQQFGTGSGISQVTGSAEVTPEAIEVFEIGFPPGSVRGQGRIQFAMDLVPGVPVDMTLSSDLQGLGLRIPELGWSKPTGGTGDLQLNVTLGAAPRVNSLALNAAGLSVQGQASVRPNGGLDRAQLSSVRLRDWLNARVELIGRGPGQTPDIRILGGTLDLRAADFGEGGSGQGRGVARNDALVVALDRLQVTDTIALTNFRGEFSTAAGIDGPFNGRINGQTTVTGRLVPRDGRTALRILSTDAGGVFRDAGLLKQARGGEFTMTLLPLDQPGAFDGSLRVTNTRIQDAPAIAALLNAVSIVGLLNELAGQGILFGDVSARFRLTPSQVTLYESSATGPSIGISMDGRYDVSSRRLAMNGVISPVYLLNGIGSVLTRPGEGLIGFNYTLRGTADDPSVQVNPLSALAPSFLRDIFRAPRPETPPAATSSGDAPQPPERRERPRGGDR